MVSIYGTLFFFKCLQYGSNDRKNCSLVCRRWYDVESLSRR
nr:F-box protein SKIP2-like [Ipomoea batatas]